jgi:hypothetical protein
MTPNIEGPPNKNLKKFRVVFTKKTSTNLDAQAACNGLR